MSKQEAIFSYWNGIIAIQLMQCSSPEDVARRIAAESNLERQLQQLPEETLQAVYSSHLSDLICAK